MTSIALFHSVLGVRQGALDAASRLRGAGHDVLVVDQYDCRVFDDYDAAEKADRLLGKVVTTIESRPRLRDRLTLIVTADHGGAADGHGDPTQAATFRILFVVWGVGVEAGADLYELNDDYRDPGSRRTKYGATRQPVRNGDAANLATRLLGLGRIPHSEFGFDRRLDVS